MSKKEIPQQLLVVSFFFKTVSGVSHGPFFRRVSSSIGRCGQKRHKGSRIGMLKQQDDKKTTI